MAQRRSRKRNTSAMAKANRALALASSLAASREQKYELTTWNNADISSSGAVFYLNRVEQGDEDDGQRDGDTIHCTRIDVEMQLSQPPALNGIHAIRMIVILDKQNTLANTGELLLGVSSGESPMLVYSKDYALRSQVLYDSHAITLDTYNPSKCIHFSRKLNIETRFLAASDTITTGALKALFITDIPTSSPNYPHVSGCMRVMFTDS